MEIRRIAESDVYRIHKYKIITRNYVVLYHARRPHLVNPCENPLIIHPLSYTAAYQYFVFVYQSTTLCELRARHHPSPTHLSPLGKPAR